jgi:hypothetical protein
MNANRYARVTIGAMAIVVAYAITASAQVQTQTSTKDGQATKNVTVERGEVVWVSGNNLMVKEEGTGQLRYFPEVPAAARAMVGGKQLSVNELKPGMKLERTTIVTTTPRTIRTIKTVEGTVWHVTPPNSIILTLANRTNQKFTIPKGQKFLVDGKETDAFELRPGQKISASVMSDREETVVDKQVSTTGVAAPAPAPAPPPPQAAVLIVQGPPTPTPATPPPAARELPSTGSVFPTVGLLGLTLCGMALALRRMRQRTAAHTTLD